MNLIRQNTQLSTHVEADMDHYRRLKQELEAKADRIRKHALIDAETLSQRDYRIKLPELQLRVEELRQEYRQLRADIDLALNAKSAGLIGNHEAKEFSQHLNELGIKLGDLKKKISEHPANERERATPLNGYEKLLLLAPFILLGLDMLFEAPALRILGGSGLLAYGTALLLNGCKYYFSKFLNKRIKTSDNSRIQLFWVLVGAAVFGGVAIILGISRHAYLQMQDGGSLYGPLVLAALSFFFSMAAWVSEFLAEDVREKKDRVADINRVFVEYDALQKDREELEEKIRTTKNERSGRLGSRLITMDNARSLEQYLDDHFRSTANKWQVVYHSRRTDQREGDDVFITDISPLNAEFIDRKGHIQNSQS
ncbi:MAG: hypothetical protein GC178_18135 [Flavobacteriales bacterium]|nr:hypothetical protein [Flavobacteriales bacterium]